MTLLVTLEEAKEHLEMDHDASDDKIERMIHQASQIVLDHIKDRALEIVDTSGELIVDSSGNSAVPYNVQAAVLLMIGVLFGNRGEDGGQAAGFSEGYLPPGVRALLFGKRTPTIA